MSDEAQQKISDAALHCAMGVQHINARTVTIPKFEDVHALFGITADDYRAIAKDLLSVEGIGVSSLRARVNGTIFRFDLQHDGTITHSTERNR